MIPLTGGNLTLPPPAKKITMLEKMMVVVRTVMDIITMVIKELFIVVIVRSVMMCRVPVESSYL